MAQLEDEEFELAADIMQMNDKGLLKGAKATTRRRASNKVVAKSCSANKFKDLASINPTSLNTLLQQVKDKELSLQEMATEAKIIKDYKEIQRSLEEILDTKWKYIAEK